MVFTSGVIVAGMGRDAPIPEGGYLLHSPGPQMLWFSFEFSPSDCGLVSQADTHLARNRRNSFNSCFQPGPEKLRRTMLQARFAGIFSGWYPSNPVSTTWSGECNAITN